MPERPLLATHRRPADTVPPGKQASQPAPPPRLGPTVVPALPVPKARERTVSKTIRIPISLLDQMEEICTARGLELSPLVLFFIAQGLQQPLPEETPDASHRTHTNF